MNSWPCHLSDWQGLTPEELEALTADLTLEETDLLLREMQMRIHQLAKQAVKRRAKQRQEVKELEQWWRA